MSEREREREREAETESEGGRVCVGGSSGRNVLVM